MLINRYHNNPILTKDDVPYPVATVHNAGVVKFNGTARGWLSIYHGVFPAMDGCVYRLGVAMHNLEDPSRIIAVGDEWILQPEEDYEITGYVHNVVFTESRIIPKLFTCNYFEFFNSFSSSDKLIQA